MSNYVTLTFTEQDAGQDAGTGQVSIAPTSAVVVAGSTIVSTTPVVRNFSSGTLSVSLFACDNTGTTPAEGFWAYEITLPGGQPQFYLVNYSNGATQRFDNLTPVVEQVTFGAAGSSGGFTDPMQNLGDMIYMNATPAPAALAGNTSATKKFLAQTGTGSASAAPAWGTIAAGDVPTLNQSTTGTAAGLSSTLAVGSGGTGQTTQQAAMDALAGATTSGDYLRGNGSHVVMAAIPKTDLGTTPGSSPANNLPLLYGGVWGWPWQFLPESWGAKGDVQVGLCSVSSGSAVVTLTTGTVASGDVGKNVCICGGTGPAPSGPTVDTIASVNVGANQWTLATQTAGLNATGLAVVWASDDRADINSAASAASTYAQAHDYFAQVLLEAAYGTGTGLFQQSGAGLFTYNAQIPILAAARTGITQKMELQFVTHGNNSHEQYWESSIPNLAAGALVSFTSGPTTPDATYGQQSVIGGPTGGLLSAQFANVKPVFKGIQVWQPGWSNSWGIDLLWCGGYAFEGGGMFAFAPPTSDNGVNPYNAWPANSFWRGKIGGGVRFPGIGNNQDAYVTALAAAGLNTGYTGGGDGFHADLLRAVSCDVPYKLDFSLGLGGTPHGVVINRLYFENSNAGLNVNGSGPCPIYAVLDGENNSLLGYDLNDSLSALHGEVHWSDPFRSPAVPSLNGAANVKFVNDLLGPGYYSGAPSVPATTVTATAPRDAWVVITSGGAAVTVIAIDGQATGLTLSTSGSVTVRVPALKTIALTYASTAPTWKWWLD